MFRKYLWFWLTEITYLNYTFTYKHVNLQWSSPSLQKKEKKTPNKQTKNVSLKKNQLISVKTISKTNAEFID